MIHPSVMRGDLIRSLRAAPWGHLYMTSTFVQKTFKNTPNLQVSIPKFVVKLWCKKFVDVIHGGPLEKVEMSASQSDA